MIALCDNTKSHKHLYATSLYFYYNNVDDVQFAPHAVQTVFSLLQSKMINLFVTLCVFLLCLFSLLNL